MFSTQNDYQESKVDVDLFIKKCHSFSDLLKRHADERQPLYDQLALMLERHMEEDQKSFDEVMAVLSSVSTETV